MNRATDITSVTEHRAKLKEHLQQARETGRPLFVTANGSVEGVVLSPAVYDALMDEVELSRSLEMIRESDRDIAAGRTLPAKEAVEQIARHFGVTLDACTDTASS